MHVHLRNFFTINIVLSHIIIGVVYEKELFTIGGGQIQRL